MKPGFVMACTVNFGARVDQFVGDSSVEFYDLHPFSVAQQSPGGFSEDWVASPYNIAFYEVPLYSWHWCCSSLGPDASEVSCIGVCGRLLSP
jgi:hypothetical protein